MNAGVFLDRDGVLIEDVDFLTRIDQVRILPGVPQALLKLATHGYKLIVVTNQSAVARGMVTEAEVVEANRHLNRLLAAAGGRQVDEFYVCPHHPKGSVEKYRVICECRKPRHGMLLRAAQAHGLDLRASFLVGDRMTDVMAGARAGCRTVLLTTGAHELAPSEMVEPLDASVKPAFTCASLKEAADWIVEAL